MANEIHVEDGSLDKRPGIFLIGSPNVGKRTILSRLLSIDIHDTSDLSEGILCQGWKLETKYYSADISIWMTHLNEDFSFRTLPVSKQLAGLVMVFDMNDESTFLALKDWIDKIDLEKFEILLCIGNKADLVPGHSAHVEYRRYLQKQGDSTCDPHPGFLDYGINEEEGCSLLGDEDSSLDVRNSCLEWCVEHNIEYVEACASNSNFDKCLSVDGDIQGVQRLYEALSVHMWPGMVMKSGGTVTAPSTIAKDESTDEESDFEIEYEVLSGGSDEQWEFVGGSSNTHPSTSRDIPLVDKVLTATKSQDINQEIPDVNEARVFADASASQSTEISSEISNKEDNNQENHDKNRSTFDAEVRDISNIIDSDDDSFYGHEDMEKLMCEIGSMRDNLRLLPDFQRREMAAKLAMKMASMFGYSTDEDSNEYQINT